MAILNGFLGYRNQFAFGIRSSRRFRKPLCFSWPQNVFFSSYRFFYVGKYIFVCVKRNVIFEFSVTRSSCESVLFSKFGFFGFIQQRIPYIILCDNRIECKMLYLLYSFLYNPRKNSVERHRNKILLN